MRHAGEYHWTISLDVDCPNPLCGHSFDANETDDFGEQIRGVQVCQEKKGILVTCPQCNEEFIFDIAGGT
jgi:hypothetical protein